VLMLARSRIDMTNGAKTPTRQTPMVRLARRISRRIILALSSSNREEFGLRRRPRRLNDAARIYSMIDHGLSAFYDDAASLELSSLDSETAALKRQLTRLSRFVEKRRGIAPERLNSMISHS
jgi:hypothetical protein